MVAYQGDGGGGFSLWYLIRSLLHTNTLLVTEQTSVVYQLHAR